MDFELSEDQKMLRKTARDFLANECTKAYVREMELNEKGYSPDMWQKMADLGWMGLPFPEQCGGWGGSFLDLAVLMEEMGRACLPGPFMASVVLGGLTILGAGSDAQKEQYLTAIAGGGHLHPGAHRASASYDAAAVHDPGRTRGRSYVINGTKLFVPDAHVANYLIVVATYRGGRRERTASACSWWMPRAAGSVTPAQDHWQRQAVRGRLRRRGGARGQSAGEARPRLADRKRTLQQAATAKCAEMVGAAQQVLEMTTAYAKERVQFDKPIGSFAGIQHHCQDVIDVDGMRISPTTPRGCSARGCRQTWRWLWLRPGSATPSSGWPSWDTRSTAAWAIPLTTICSCTIAAAGPPHPCSAMPTTSGR